ncbi:cdp-diacylglycerol synthetase-like protein [Leishmania panamensis]|uniref:Phosphatidate cytidylyltransferase n=3 Tax=Viannia TaxID=37616 RepID=A0A088RTF5_LEIPA|nr:cdp-diacylglycerol synthetase-like protein [Leishmania panamensis]AIN99273.1 cdp-diacylglycerol synthetase-like protein [Leishmania panamensis]
MPKEKKERVVLLPLIPTGGNWSPAVDGTMATDKPSTGDVATGTSHPATTSTSAADSKKVGYKDIINRTVFTILMAYVFLGWISVGIRFGLFLLFVIETTMFYEVTRINQRARKERQLPSVLFIKWYFFVVSYIFVSVSCNREPLQNTFAWFEKVYDLLPFVFFCCVMLGLVIFVLSLRKGMYRYQFIQFTWTAMMLMFSQVQFAGEMRNMVRGMIWFLLPVSCVVNNDIWAYIFGKCFGRKKLLSLSPKKTVEGFLGAFLFTVIWSFWFCGFLSYFPQMYCPAVGFTNAVNTQCIRNPVFFQEEVAFPQWVQQVSGGMLKTFLVSPAQKHAIVLGTFASLLAPFGGFFASGLKRAFKLKDFGDLIPGHGGMTDRMDCQGLMGLFTYCYLRTYVFHEVKCPGANDITRCALGMDAKHRQTLVSQLLQSLQA